MRSEKSADVQKTLKRSFIEEARRKHIVAAAIDTLAEVGYGKASLAQIARRAAISPSLIAYHFNDKDALIEYTLTEIATAWDSFVAEQVAAGSTAREQLQRYIEASLGYMGARPAHFAALIEIVFNARTKDGVLLYRVDDEEPGLALLKSVLMRGQQNGEFRACDAHAVAIAIRGAINEFFGEMHKPGVSLEPYTNEVIALFLRAIARDES
jgi:TetR/AcrR family transcriptional regulator, transcriptional repressor of bet genes